jgi:hypothetical protein
MLRLRNSALTAALIVLSIGLSELCLLRWFNLVAQELTPRTFWPAPKGTRVAVVGYSYSFGDVLMDPSLPVSGVDSAIHTGVIAYLQTFSLGGRTANLLLEQPYSWGTTKGQFLGLPARRDFSGLGDLGVTLGVNLLGAPSMNRAEFQELRANPRPILGASLKVVPSWGMCCR